MFVAVPEAPRGLPPPLTPPPGGGESDHILPLSEGELEGVGAPEG